MINTPIPNPRQSLEGSGQKLVEDAVSRNGTDHQKFCTILKAFENSSRTSRYPKRRERPTLQICLGGDGGCFGRVFWVGDRPVAHGAEFKPKTHALKDTPSEQREQGCGVLSYLLGEAVSRPARPRKSAS